MATPNQVDPNHRIYPHTSVLPFAPRMWYVVGSLGRSPVPRNMVIVKLKDDSILIHSGIAVDEPTRVAIDQLGPVRYIIVPSPIHRLDAAWMKSRFSKAKILCPQAAEKKVSEIVDVDGSCEEILPKLGVKVHTIPGIKPTELCYEFDSGNGPSFVFCDALMNLPKLPGLQGRLLRLLGSTGFFGITRIGRLVLMRDRTAYRAWLKQLSERQGLHSIVPSHGDPVRLRINSRLAVVAARI